MKTHQVLKPGWMLIAFSLSLSAQGQGTFVYDQQSVTSDALSGSGGDILHLSPIGQSFTPSFDSVGFIRLEILGGGPPPGGESAIFSVNLMSDSMTGPVLGSTEPVTMPPRGPAPTTFFFPTPVTVIPGQS
jgi:hypothetical protein